MLPPQRNKRLADGGYAKRIKEDVNIVDEMIECNRKNPDLVSEGIRIGGRTGDNLKTGRIQRCSAQHVCCKGF